MKHFILPIVFILAIATSFGQTKVAAQSSNKNAKMGETVWLCVYHVKANKKAQYEHFVHDLFWPGASKLSAAEQKIFRQTRVMHPEKADKDGTFAYSFLMDPVIKGADYDIESLIKKMYGKEKGAEYYKLFDDAITSEKDYKQYNMVQSKD